jgi:hypothetical protein
MVEMPDAVETGYPDAPPQHRPTPESAWTAHTPQQARPRSTPTTQPANREEWYDRMAGVIVAVAGLFVLLSIMIVAMLLLPDGTEKGTNIVALASAGFGVIGAVVGAFFGVRAANRAVNKMSAQTRDETEA